MNRLMSAADIVSGIGGFVIPIIFAWTIYQKGIPQNVATWLMVFLLDLIGVILVFKEGNRLPYLQIGWTFSAVCIILATVSTNPWQWGNIETISLLLCGISIIFWISLSARFAMWAYTVAMYVACIPLVVDYYHVPQRETLWVWLWTVGACFLAIFGVSKKSFANVFVPCNAIIINCIIAILALN